MGKCNCNISTANHVLTQEEILDCDYELHTLVKKAILEARYAAERRSFFMWLETTQESQRARKIPNGDLASSIILGQIETPIKRKTELTERDLTAILHNGTVWYQAKRTWDQLFAEHQGDIEAIEIAFEIEAKYGYKSPGLKPHKIPCSLCDFLKERINTND